MNYTINSKVNKIIGINRDLVWNSPKKQPSSILRLTQPMMDIQGVRKWKLMLENTDSKNSCLTIPYINFIKG